MKVWVLSYKGECIGAYGNLKKLCESVDDPNFPSYWTLVRKKFDVFELGDYRIERVKYH